MSTLILGGTGFIGRRLVPLLAQRGEEIVCMDINPGTASYGQLGKQVRVVRGDVTPVRRRHGGHGRGQTVARRQSRLFSRQRARRRMSRPSSTSSAWTIASRRRASAASTGSSSPARWRSAASRTFYGDRVVTEDDFRHGHVQYAMHKIFNEWQAQDYREKYGMEITAIRPANVTGPDKIVGSVDHVKCITFPARGEAISFPYKDAMRCPVHVDDIAEVFARVLLTDKPRHAVYNTGGTADQPRRSRRSRARVPARRADHLRARDRRQGDFRQLPDRQHPADPGIRAAVSALPRSAYCRSSTTPAAKPACRPSPTANRGELCPPVAGRGLCSR